MKILPKILLLFLSVLIFSQVPGYASPNATTKQSVVIIHSYHQGFKWTDSVNAGIFSIFDASDMPENLEIFVEYLDAKRNSDSLYLNHYIKTLKLKYSKVNTQLLITSDDIAFEFAVKNRKQLFNDVPIVFCGVNHFPSYKNTLLKNKNDYTGVVEAFDLKSTLDLAFEQFPRVKKVYVINDETSTGLQNQKVLRDVLKQQDYKIPFVNLEPFLVSQVDSALAMFDSDGIVLLLSYNKDAGDNYFDYDEIGKIVSQSTKLPVYVIWDFYLGTGVLGGKVISGKTQGKQAALMGIDILNGAKASDIPVIKESPNVFMFDYQQALKHGLDKRDFPPETVFINQRHTFFSKYFKEIVVLSIILFLLVSAIVGLLINIKYKGIAEKNLKSSKLKLTNILQTAKEGFVEFDFSGQIKQVNKELSQILETPPQKLLEKSIFEALKIKSSSKHKSLFNPCFEGKALSIEYQVAVSPIKIKYLNINATPLFDDFGNVTGGFALIGNITRQKQFEQDLIEAKEKAEKSDKLKSAFLANMSHEIRTPMNAIIGFSELLNDNTLEPDRRKLFLETIQSSGRNLLSLINDILDLSKIEAGELDLAFEQTNINQLFNNLYISFSETKQFQNKDNIDFIIYPPENDLFINTDSLRLTQILTNLLNNAFKFTAEGSIKMGLTIINDNTIKFYVKDTGIGLPPEKTGEIFKRFSKIDDSATQLYNGAGLGLAITKNLVNLLNGDIWVESTQGNGTTFFFTIQGDIIHKINKTRKTKKNSDHLNKLKGKHILLAEDNLESAFLMKEIFKKHEVKLTLAKDGNMVIRLLKKHPDIDLVLMDICMPELDGIKATKKIKNIKFDMPVIAVTAKAMRDEEEKARAAGCDLYLTKPINKQLLISSIVHLLS